MIMTRKMVANWTLLSTQQSLKWTTVAEGIAVLGDSQGMAVSVVGHGGPVLCSEGHSLELQLSARPGVASVLVH